MRYMALIAILVACVAPAAFAGDDPSIKGKLRTDIQKAKSTHIDENSVKSKYLVYDAVAGKLQSLVFKGLHEGIVKKAEFYVSCADFVDGSGRKFDLDFLVVEDGGKLKVTQGLVHSIDGENRKYHLEAEAVEGKVK